MSCIAENCAKTFGAAPVFEKVSLRVDPGEIVCLMGPSGAGKTTLLRCLCGLELPEKGTISLSGTVLCQDGRWQSPVQYRQKIGPVCWRRKSCASMNRPARWTNNRHWK